MRVSIGAGRTYDGLERLGRELQAYFAGPIESITLEGVMEIVRRHLATLKPVRARQAGAQPDAAQQIDLGGAEGEGVGAGADVDVTAEHTVGKTWWLGGEDDLVEIAAKKGKQPRATVEPDKKKDGGGKDATMRFQVQWNTKDKKKGRTYSAVARGKDPPGIKVSEAIAQLNAAHNSVVEKRAKESATPAVNKQADWIRARPPAGIATEGTSRSEYFDYDYDDARVDVENIRGHNLRQP